MIINEDIWEAHGEGVIAIKGVVLLNANDDHLAVNVFP